MNNTILKLKKEYNLKPRVQRVYFNIIIIGIIYFFFGLFSNIDILEMIGMALILGVSLSYGIVEYLIIKGYKFKK